MAFNIKDKFGEKIQKFFPNENEQPGLWIMILRTNSKTWVTEHITDFSKQGQELCCITGLLKELTKHGSIYECIIEMPIFLIYILHMPDSRICEGAIWRCRVILRVWRNSRERRLVLNQVHCSRLCRAGCSAHFLFVP